MKHMVQGWIQDAIKYRNVLADEQIVSFYRWLHNTTSLMYDPALSRTLHRLMTKLFMQLIAEFKRLGAQIVYASFTRLLLVTNKRSVEDALAYVEFVTNSVRSKQLFSMLDISYARSWRILMWLDMANYGGIEEGPPPTADPDDPSLMKTPKRPKRVNNNKETESGDEEDWEGADIDVQMHWNIAKFLPEVGSCQANFSMLVKGYILAMFHHLEEELARIAPGHTPIRRRGLTPSQTPGLATPGREAGLGTGTVPGVVAYSQELVQGQLSQQLLLITDKMNKKLTTSFVGSDLSDHFPQPPGAHLPLKNPTLEFVKTVCQVLALDSNVGNQVRKLRRDLLKLIGVGEFSDSAAFRDPCLTYTLPQLICSSCNAFCDLDLCRDINVDLDDGASSWRCAQCGEHYDIDEIEHKLLVLVNRRLIDYQLQDLVCTKCKGIKESNLSKRCSCAGEYQTTVKQKEIGQMVTTFKSIAEHFKMELLFETVTWLIRSDPGLQVS